MRLVSGTVIASKTPLALEVPRGSLPFEFGPVKEPASSPEPTFLSKDPETIYRTGDYTPVPLMIGANSVRHIHNLTTYMFKKIKFLTKKFHVYKIPKNYFVG